jgi:flavorubredoxin
MTITTHNAHGSTVGELLPRELTDGVYWLGDCFVWPAVPGADPEHAYTSAYLVTGSECSMLVDTGHPNDWLPIARQLDDLLDKGVPDLRWIFATHPEVTHAGNLGRLMAKYPRARMISNTLDFHLSFPDFTDRFEHIEVGDEIDLGDRSFDFIEAVFRDLPNSVWGYDRKGQVLFCSDGLGFGHYHAAEHCGKFAEEITDLDMDQATKEFMESALYWSRLKSPVPHTERLQELIRTEFPVKLVAPAHGSPIMDPSTTVPRIVEAMIKMAGEMTLVAPTDE